MKVGSSGRKAAGIPGSLIGPPATTDSGFPWALLPQLLFSVPCGREPPSCVLRFVLFSCLEAILSFVTARSALAMADKVARSGITTDAATGERYIPSSVRADGSKRKEIKVRPGYKPPEDVELYRNRAAAAWKNRAKGGVPGADVSNEENKAPPTESTAASNKNAKRREAKRKAKESEPEGAAVEKKGAESDNWRVAADKAAQNPPEEPIDTEAEKEKKARNLKKKLRQARDLRDKKNQGEALLPEQLEKIIKIQELVRQLDSLGLDANGEKQEDGAEKNV